ncbi:hypothetical protein ACFP1Z_22315 [Streptomyces gamaensis]|uniref:Uncharacterized protein n=1 Tax=Streptomyces gamaensis TaxID=1763542 RepID=A0ABW0Z8I8_9ACTN
MYTTEPVADRLQPSPQEDQLAEDYASLLGTVSRIDEAVREGAWHGVRDELDQLISAAEDMWSTLSDPDPDYSGEDPESDPRRTPVNADPATVRQLVAAYAEPGTVTRALYPPSVITDPHLRAAVAGVAGPEDPLAPAEEQPVSLR